MRRRNSSNALEKSKRIGVGIASGRPLEKTQWGGEDGALSSFLHILGSRDAEMQNFRTVKSRVMILTHFDTF